MKLLYLLKKQYSRFYLREIVMVMQVIMMITLFTPILFELNQLLAVRKLASAIQHPALFFQADDYYFMPEFLEPEEYQAVFEEIGDCPYVTDVGLTSSAGCTVDGEGTTVYFYNDALLKNLKFDIKDVDYPDNVIPVMIDHSLSRKYHIGDIITPESPLLFLVSAERLSVQFVVVGYIEDSNRYYYHFVGGASDVRLESIGRKDEQPCMIAVKSFDLVPIQDINPSSLLFVESANQATLDAINESIGHLGHAERIEVMLQNSLNYILIANPLPFVTAALMVLLCLASVCSYTYVNMVRLRENMAVYYICGLSRKKAMTVSMIALMLLLMISILVSVILMPICVEATEYSGLPYAITIVVGLFIISFVIVLAQYGSTNPIRLMRKGD